MRKPRWMRLAAFGLLCGLSLALSGAATIEAGTDRPLAEAPAAIGGGGGLTPFCPPTNDAGCAFSDIACAGFHCCCIYAGPDCPSGSTSAGPCTQF